MEEYPNQEVEKIWLNKKLEIAHEDKELKQKDLLIK